MAASVRSPFAGVSVGLIFLGLAACGEPSSSGPRIGFRDACLMITVEEATKALGAPAEKGVTEHDVTDGNTVHSAQCIFRSRTHPSDRISVAFDAHPSTNKDFLFKKARDRATARDIAGIGDGAQAFQSPIGFVDLTAKAGDALVKIYVSSSTAPDALDAAKALGKAAAARYAAGENIRAIPGTDAFVGHWAIAPATLGQTGARGALALIEVDRKGRWTMTAAEIRAGMLGTDGARFRFAAKDGPIDGRYKRRGEDRLTVSGDLKVKFTRVACDAAPALVDPELLTRFGAADTLRRKPEFDKELVGLWEGQGTVEGEKVTALWTIRKGGDAVLMILRDSKGALKARDGAITWMAKGSNDAVGTYSFPKDQLIALAFEESKTEWRPHDPDRDRGKTGIAVRGPCPGGLHYQ